jgi:hypothetical protein
MRALRILLLVDAAAMLAASTISDPILGDVALAPTLLVCVLGGIASLSADLVRPRRRLDVVCSGLSIIAPFPFLVLGHPWGPRLGAIALATLQIVPLVRGGWHGRSAELSGPRRILAALTLLTLILLIAFVGAVWYGSRYLVRQPAGVWLRAPYLVSLTTDSASFRWQLKDGQPAASVRVRAPDGSTRTAQGGRLTGLQPGTRYQWTADVGGSAAAAGAFTTAPETIGRRDITVVSFGDYGSGNEHEYAVGRLAAAVDPSLFLSGGDNSYLLSAPPFLNRAIFTPLRQLLGEAAPAIALGEHDLAWNGGSAVKSAFDMPGERYAVQYGPVQVVVLGLQADGPAIDFARRTLGRCSPACPVRLVLVHRPIDAANAIMPLLRQRHVAAILAAHLHRYERHVRAGILELTIGTGGEGPGSAQYTKATPDAIVSFIAYGFVEIVVHGTTIDYRFIDESGRVRDHVTRPA